MTRDSWGSFVFRVYYMSFNGKEESEMKTFIKYTAVGVAGYLVGFYEMKYKATKALLKVMVEKESEDSKEDKEES